MKLLLYLILALRTVYLLVYLVINIVLIVINVLKRGIIALDEGFVGFFNDSSGFDIETIGEKYSKKEDKEYMDITIGVN